MSNSAQASASSRIAALLDENSFVEVGAYTAARSTDFNTTEQGIPADGVVTGCGTIGGCPMYIYSQDASILGGSMGEMHAKKICNIYSMAMKMGALVTGLVDCAGLRLQEATDALDGFGRLHLSQTMTSGVIPQITAIFEICGGSMAVSAGITDFTFVEEKSGKPFANSPNAINDNYKEKRDTSSADFQSRGFGLADFIGDEASIIAQIRALASTLPANNEDDMSYGECQDDLNRICGNIEGCTGDTALTLTPISDNSLFMETRKNYEPSMVTGFICPNGTTIGCMANRTEIYENGEKKETFEPALFGKGRDKTTDFIHFCDAFNIPVLTLVDVKGYEAKMCNERGTAKTAARLTYAYTNASVPKVTAIVKGAFGGAYLTMGSKSIGVDVVYVWPGAVISMMNPPEVAKIMYAKEIAASGDAAALISGKTTEYIVFQSGAVATAKRGYADGIIKAGETRQRVIAAFEVLFTKREDRPSKKYGMV